MLTVGRSHAKESGDVNWQRVVGAWTVILATLAGGLFLSACQRNEPAPARTSVHKVIAPDKSESGADNGLSAPASDDSADPADTALALAPAKKPGVKKPATTSAQTKPAATTGYGDEAKKPKIDPVALNGPIFEGWTKPALAIVISGEQNGYLEPCGCAGLENQKGGLSRRWTMFDERRKQGWELVPVDLGGIVRRYGPQAEIQYQLTAEVLRSMGYAAVGYGPADLRLPGAALVQAVGDALGDKSLFVAANVGLFGFDGGFVAPYRVVERGGIRLGITSVVGPSHQQQANNPDVVYRPAEEALDEIVPKLVDESDLRILLSHGTPEESKQLAQKFPDFDLVVTAGGADEPPQEPEELGDSTRLIEVGHKGMYCVVVGVYPEAESPLKFQRVPLDSRFVDAPQMRETLVQYQDQLRLAGWEGLGLRTAQHPRTRKPGDAEGQFVGAERCGTCHKQAHAKWRETKHAHATETLTKLTPARHFDPECISCHSVGWNAKEYYPFETGFVSLEATPALVGNGCENCHGPGRGHSEAEERRPPRNLADRDRMRQAMRLTKATAKESVCEKCHDLDNSPEFHKDGAFDRYWSKVEHKGKD